MEIKNISSFDEMQSFLSPKSRNYVLLYKKGSEVSDCSYNSLVSALDKSDKINVAAVDVNFVRDIHTKYEVTSAPSLLVFEGQKFSKVVKGCNDEGFYKGLFEDSLYHATYTGEEKPRKRVTVYSTPSCSWCNTLKTYLKKNNIRFTDIDVSKDQKAAEAMVNRSGQQGVPQTDINGEIIIGFDKTRINTLLGIQ